MVRESGLCEGTSFLHLWKSSGHCCSMSLVILDSYRDLKFLLGSHHRLYSRDVVYNQAPAATVASQPA